MPQLSHSALNAGQSARLMDLPSGCDVLPHPLHGWIELGDDVKAVVKNAKVDDFEMDFANKIITMVADPMA